MATNPADKFAQKTFGQLESQISRMYREAYKDVSKKMADFTRRHKAKDKQMQRDLKNGKITKEQYASWLRGQVFIGQQWQDAKASIDMTIKNVMGEAASLTHQKSIDVFVDNANHTAYQIEKDFNGAVNFSLYDRKTISRLILEDPELLPRRKDINGRKLEAWNTKIIANCVSQAILQGESIDELSKRIARDTGIEAGRSSLLYARTAMTGAQNAGRVERMKEAEEMGIKVQKQWMSTLDSRTRDSHRYMDGEIADTDEEFSNGLEYPGDPDGDPREVYNCRCTLIYHYPEYSDYSKMERTAYYEEGDPEYDPNHRNYEVVKGMNYEQWFEWRKAQIKERYAFADGQNETRTMQREKITGEEERRDDIMAITGMSEEQANKVAYALFGYKGDPEHCYFDGADSEIRSGATPEDKEMAKEIQKFIDRSPKYEGTIYRGMAVDEETLASLVPGMEFNEKRYHISSWSSNEQVGQRYANMGQHEMGGTRVVFQYSDPVHGAPVAHLSPYPTEQEVLVNNDNVRYIIVSRESYMKSDREYVKIVLEEIR